ncbi:TfuA domain-containing protein [Sphingomicrobium arenosum]|uniref:TfuA domain-containing protein n=1 Tax=Sphingomicrobium arenosum TaxID=2233861 RepID=UPI00224009EA|nr:TfuA domain-containing protein [Sphingomicrobium arenosum]
MIVFAGPSAPRALRAAFPHLDWRAPAVSGDLLSLIEKAPAKVLLLDGLFEERAAVMHKEALALMAAGTRLYGASSMGALRAAELAPFGMVPLGHIAQAYRSGLLIGDDEVALVHGDARIGWQPVSVPMVEVRATLCRLVRDEILSPAAARDLRARWHDIHYVDREWPVMRAAADDLPPALLDRIEAAHVPLKALDAERSIALALADARPACSLPPSPPPETHFLRTLRDGLNRCR